MDKPSSLGAFPSHLGPASRGLLMLGPMWLELPSPIHSYKPNTSSIRKSKPSTSRIVTPSNSQPMTYIYIYIYILGL